MAGERGRPRYVNVTSADSTRQPLRQVRRADDPACRQLFEQVFGQPISPAFWDWKYAEGRGFSFFSTDRTGQPSGHYGAMGRDLHFQGETFAALQVCDVMVAQPHRGLLTREGVFCQLARRFQEEAFAQGQPFRLAFGFPNARAMRLAEHLGLYEESDRIESLNWTPLRRRPWVRLESLAGTVSSRSDEALNDLWAAFRQAHNHCLMTVRDAYYWRDRYLTHPVHQYSCYLIRSAWRHRVMGALCLKIEGSQLQLMDVLWERGRMDAVVHVARWLAHQWGLSGLSAWATPAQGAEFLSSNPEVRETDIRIPINRWVQKVDPEGYRGRWWITMGDTDFM